MADQEITKLAALTAADADDLLVIVDDPSGGASTKKILASAINKNFIRTAAEITAGITPTNFQDTTSPYDVRRVGIIPDSTAARTANTTAIKGLFDSTVTGPVGSFIFPNVTGASTYHFDNIVEIRDGCHLDLQGCTIDFTKAAHSSADDFFGFFTFIRDVSIENGSVNVDYNGTAGTNAGMVFRIGARVGYAFAGDPDIEDEDFTIPMGGIVLKNLRLTSNNPGPMFGVFLTGGLDGVDIEDCTFNGTDVIEHAFLYEFGNHHFETTVANRTSSHALNVHFKNIKGFNLKNDGTAGSVVSLVGVGDATLENIFGDVCFNVVQVRPGEALYFKVGAPWVAAGHTRHVVLKNINGQNLTNSGLALGGAESSAGGFLSGEGLSEAQQTDLIGFSVDGFSFDQTIATVTGPLSLRNGVGKGGSSSGGLILGEECIQFEIDNVQILDSLGDGIRANIANAIWATPRLKVGSIRNSQIAGSATGGIVLGQTKNVLIENCRLGYDALYDATAELTQDNGLNVATTAKGIVCRGNHVKTFGGTAYVKAGTDGDRNCNIEGATGEVTLSAGQWKLDNIASANSTDIANDTANINANDKYTGKLVYDSSNKRILRAAGAGATDDWELVDGTVQVTPV